MVASLLDFRYFCVTKDWVDLMSDQVQTSGGIGFGGVLFMVFLVLKLTGHIDWSWWWIFSPFWVPLLVGAVLMVMLMAYMAIKE